MRCHVCEDFASSSGMLDPPSGAPERSDLFCERCGVALPRGGAVGPALRRLSQLARFGVAGLTRRARRSRGAVPEDI